MTRQQIINNVKQLPRSEQIDLAMELWDAVDVREGDFPLNDEQKAELDRRLTEASSNRQPAEDLESLKTRLLRGEF